MPLTATPMMRAAPKPDQKPPSLSANQNAAVAATIAITMERANRPGL
jgi:hypothetical protein